MLMSDSDLCLKAQVRVCGFPGHLCHVMLYYKSLLLCVLFILINIGEQT